MQKRFDRPHGPPVPADLVIMLLTPIVAVIVGLSLQCWQIWKGLDAGTRGWPLFRDSVAADWEYVRTMGTAYATTGLMVGVVVAILVSLYRHSGIEQE